MMSTCFNPHPVIAHGVTIGRRHRWPVHTFQSAPRDCSRGDSSFPTPRMIARLFQSAPRDCSRGDAAGISHPAQIRCFNPHPVIAHGVTQREYLIQRKFEFQSAPRDCSRGDMTTPAFVEFPKMFQSAPRDCSRGDMILFGQSNRCSCFNPHPVIAHGVTR